MSVLRLRPVVVHVEAQLDDLAGRVLRDQLARRALGDDAAAVHDHEPVAELLGLVHVVRREHERHALPLQLVEPLPHEVARLRVEAGGRLVEQHELGLVDQRPGDREPALHAAGQLVDPVVAAVGQLHEVQQLVGPLADHGARQAEVAAVDEQVLADGELEVEACPPAAPTPSRARISGPSRRRVEPEHPQLAAGDRRDAARSSASSRSCPRRSGRGTRTPRPARPGSRCRRPRRSRRTAWSARAPRSAAGAPGSSRVRRYRRRDGRPGLSRSRHDAESHERRGSGQRSVQSRMEKLMYVVWGERRMPERARRAAARACSTRSRRACSRRAPGR